MANVGDNTRTTPNQEMPIGKSIVTEEKNNTSMKEDNPIKSSITEGVRKTFIYLLFAIVTSLVLFILAGRFIDNYREMAATIKSFKEIRGSQWNAIHKDLMYRCDTLRPLSAHDAVISNLYSLCINDTKYIESIQNCTCPLPIVILKNIKITYSREDPKKAIKITVKMNSQGTKGLKYYASVKEENRNFSIAVEDISQWKDVDYLLEGKGNTLRIRLTSQPNKGKWKKDFMSDGDLMDMKIIKLDELNGSYAEYMIGKEELNVTMGIRVMGSKLINVTEDVEILRLEQYLAKP